MTNPPPRPALRKAPDSHVHPVSAVPPAAPSEVPAPRAELRPVVGIGGRTSDTLVAPKRKKAKTTTIEVKVAKQVVRRAKELAKARGERLDEVVSAALRGYIERG